MERKQKIGLVVAVGLSAVAVVALFSQGAIPQNPAYHQFKDARTIWGIPNFWNVVSNVPFFIVGLMGVWGLFGKLRHIPEQKPAYATFFGGVLLVAFGSGYYHVAPDNATLVWDRLPIAVAFMALFSVVLSEFLSPRLGGRMFLPLVFCGFASVLYWHFSEQSGNGDLRPYVAVQLLPILTIPIILLTCKPRYTHSFGYWCLFVAYLLAKVLEYLDGEIYALLSVISGHSLKHIAIAVGVHLLISAYARRTPTPN